MNIRLPGVETAIKYLRPNVIQWDLYDRQFIDWKCADNSKPPTWEEIEEQFLKDLEVYSYYQYAIKREKEYGDWKDQLNLLYDDIKSGNLENGKWVKMIDEVKAKHPKPETEPPFGEEEPTKQRQKESDK